MVHDARWWQTEAHRDAEALLLEHLTPEQRAQWEENRWFTHRGTLANWRLNPYLYFAQGVPEYRNGPGHWINLTRAEYEAPTSLLPRDLSALLLRDQNQTYRGHPLARGIAGWDYAGCLYYPDCDVEQVPAKLLAMLLLLRYRERNVDAGTHYRMEPEAW